MKETIAAILVLCVSGICNLIVPQWWIIAPVAFIAGSFLCNSGWKAFFSGALGAGLLWLSWSSWLYLKSSASLAKVAGIFHLPALSLPFIAAATGALVAGFSCCAGYQLRMLLQKEV